MIMIRELLKRALLRLRIDDDDVNLQLLLQAANRQ